MARRYPRHEPRRLDYFRMVADLRAIEIPTQEISRKTGVPYRTLLDWTEGARARWEDAEKLVTLWCGSTGKSRDELPYERSAVMN